MRLDTWRQQSIARQTISTKDGRTVTLAGMLQFAIVDIQVLYESLHHAEDTVRVIARAEIADYVGTHMLAECGPKEIEAGVHVALDLSRYGMGQASVRITDFCVVKTYRLIGDYGPDSMGSPLSTEQQQSPT